MTEEGPEAPEAPADERDVEIPDSPAPDFPPGQDKGALDDSEVLFESSSTVGAEMDVHDENLAAVDSPDTNAEASRPVVVEKHMFPVSIIEEANRQVRFCYG